MPRKAKEIEEVQVEKDQALYELGYLLVSEIAQAELQNEVTKIRTVLENHGATIERGEEPEMRDLAYTITLRIENIRKDYDNGYFGWVDFNVTPNAIPEIQKELKANTSIIRFIVVKKDPKDIESSSFRKSKQAESVDEAIEELVKESD